MKINVYQVHSVRPISPEQEEQFCEILNLPSLKYGYAEFIGRLDRTISKSQLKAIPKIEARFYDMAFGCWRTGCLLLGFDVKLFAECDYN